MSREPILVISVSARMLAQLAVGAGHEVVAVDGFGDLDLRRLCPSFTPAPGDGEPGALAPLAQVARGVKARRRGLRRGFRESPGPRRGHRPGA